LLGLGTFVFLRRAGCRAEGAWIGAVTAVLSGPVAGALLLGGRAQLYSLAWIPWAFAAVEHGVTAGRRGAFLGGAWVVALALLGGHPFMALQTAVAACGYGWVLAVRGQGRRSHGETAPEKTPRSIAVVFAGSALMIGIGALIAAPQLVAWHDFSQAAAKATELPPELAHLAELPPRQLLTFLFPGFFGDEVSGLYWGHFLQSFLNLYVGWLPWIVLPAALLRKQRAPAIALAIVGSGALLLACGRHVASLDAVWRAIPGTGHLHFPARWLSITSFALSALAGMGVDRLLGADEPVSRRRAVLASHLSLALLAIVTIGCSLAMRPAGDAPSAWWTAIFDGAELDPLRSSASQGIPLEHLGASAFAASRDSVLVGVAILVAFVVGLTLARRLGPRGGAALLTLLVLADLGGWSRRFVLHQDPQALRFRLEQVERLRGDGELQRYASLLSSFAVPAPDGVARHYGGLDTYGQSHMHRGLVQGLDALQFGAFGLDTMNRLAIHGGIFTQFFPSDRRILDLLNVRWVIAPPAATLPVEPGAWNLPADARGYDELELAEKNEEWALYRNPHALPRFFLVRSLRFEPDEERMWEALAAPSFDPRGEVVMLRSDAAATSSLDLGSQGSIVSAAFDKAADDDGSIRIQARTSADALLVISEAWAAGWQGTVDGRTAPVVRVDGALIGVPIASGSHRVELRYAPRSMRVAMWVSLAATLALLAAQVAVGRRRPSAAAVSA